ncbi:hypothetical protein AB6E08_10300 [Vibrio sp. 10N.247.310.24]
MKKLITNVNVFNGVDNNLIESVSVLIEDNLITALLRNSMELNQEPTI